ncbi:MAG: hypothetical protein JSS32_10015 [Verrucomicrobia bacterium]|nr:hypothetical protein [Verrucomicrobiota bacterium]
MKINKYTRIYGIIGKAICGIAGAATASLLFGLDWAIPAALAGILAAFYLERAVLNPH